MKNKDYTIDEIIKSIKHDMGTNIFNQITLNPFFENQKKGLAIIGDEKENQIINSNLHYDSFRGFGIELNYVNRNLIGDFSRFLVGVDFAEQPNINLQYQKNFGQKKQWWWKSVFFLA